jgi:hypothetical protein
VMGVSSPSIGTGAVHEQVDLAAETIPRPSSSEPRRRAWPSGRSTEVPASESHPTW